MSMFSSRVRKSIAVFFLMLIVQSVIAPGLSYALTAGPTAPEATSFEPVDTTDLVDLKTGDFTYNVPLLEVPGPAGGYPLSLSYHAGIQPEEEASWTGLGFTLNPGSISRLVNGYPDDHNSVTNVDRRYWEGEETETYTVGVSVGLANATSVSAGLQFSQNSYKGSGVGGYLGAQAGLNIGVAQFGVSSQMGISPYGDMYSAAGLSVGVGVANNVALSISGNASTSANFGGSLSAGAGVSAFGSLVDASISTGGTKPSLTVGGISNTSFNSRANKVSTKSDNFNIDIPVYNGINLRLGRNYQRSWIDEKETAFTFGALYSNIDQPGFNTALDVYDLPDLSIDVAQFNDAEKVLGGSFPDFDTYTVTAQGVSGNIRPYAFQQHLYRQDKRDASNNVLIKNHKLNTAPFSKNLEFRFINDFSNRLEYTPANFNVLGDAVTFDFEGPLITGKSGNAGYSLEKNQLTGSKHVEWYTNGEILGADPNTHPRAEGFINCRAEGFIRESNSQIGGFSVTNSSGVTYHYALPAYSFDEYMKTVNSRTKQIQNGLSYNTLTKPEKYAYTWYLTAVTGPDFVDRNNNGFADHGDWGYWVSFEYKKWLSDYQWRNPAVGVNKDIDGEFEFFSSGKKETYYLDKVLTESHVAIFEKSERLDGREVLSTTNGGFDPVRNVVTPGRQQCISNCEQFYCSGNDCEEEFQGCVQGCQSLPDDVISYVIPRPSLRLDKIKLFTYESYAASLLNDEHILRAIAFTYDYSLAQGTPNSYNNTDFSKQGKLTLLSLDFLGKKGLSLIPSTKFEYKNLPYEYGKTDVWGFYKSDYNEEYRQQTNDIIGRATTAVSQENVDAWSLITIETPLGAKVKIDYESDRYSDVVLARQQILRTKDISDLGNNQVKVTFWEEEVDLTEYFATDQIVGVDLIGAYSDRNEDRDCDCDELDAQWGAYFTRLFTGSAVIKSVSEIENYIIIEDESYYDLLKNQTKTFNRTYINDPNPSTCELNEVIDCIFPYAGIEAWPDHFPAGVISFPEKERYGGGLRVKSIALYDTEGAGRITNYQYGEGVTSYEPFEILAPKIHPDYLEEVSPNSSIKDYKRAMYKRTSKLLEISRVLPGPGVMYKDVEVSEENVTHDELKHKLPNFTKYEFETYKIGMVDMVRPPKSHFYNVNGSSDDLTFKDAIVNTVTLKDYSSRVGNLKSITLFNRVDENTAVPVSKTINHFLHDDLDGSFEDNVTTYETALNEKFTNQGLVEETFTRSRTILHKKFETMPYPQGPLLHFFYLADQRDLFATISKMENYPSVSTGQTNINYKTGVKTNAENISYDFYSGELSGTVSTDSYGNRYLSTMAPAYERYSEMGSKVDNVQNKHMLSQVAEQYSFLVNAANAPIGLMSANVQTWSKSIPIDNESPIGNVWRKHKSFSWNGPEELNTNGSYKINDFNLHQFNWVTHGPATHWEENAEMTLYDIYSHGLEAKDLNNHFAATRMDKTYRRVIANAANSSYDEMAYTGAEGYAGNTAKEGGVDRGQGVPSAAFAHTGKFSLVVDNGKKGFNYTLTSPKAELSKKYHASVWLYAPGNSETQAELDKVELYYVANGQEKTVHPLWQKSKSKSWYLLNMDIDPNGADEVYVGVRNNSLRSIYFDDFRIHPLNASLTSYVYDPATEELIFILDGNNFYTKYEYDAMGRLVRVKKELLNFDFGDGKESFRADAVLKEVNYNYGRK